MEQSIIKHTANCILNPHFLKMILKHTLNNFHIVSLGLIREIIRILLFAFLGGIIKVNRIGDQGHYKL